MTFSLHDNESLSFSYFLSCSKISTWFENLGLLASHDRILQIESTSFALQIPNLRVYILNIFGILHRCFWFCYRLVLWFWLIWNKTIEDLKVFIFLANQTAWYRWIFEFCTSINLVALQESCVGKPFPLTDAPTSSSSSSAPTQHHFDIDHAGGSGNSFAFVFVKLGLKLYP